MSHFSRLLNACVLKRNPLIVYQKTSVRFISTSNKKDDTPTITAPSTQTEVTSQPIKKKYFQDYGFGGKTEKEETILMHACFFFYVTVLCVFSTSYLLYRPSTNLGDWALREAYLELRRREQLGLPLIDPNYVDPTTVYLPSDEELGDTEIII